MHLKFAVCVLISLFIVFPAAAQDVFCGELAPPDCALFTQAQQNLASLDSAAFLIDAVLTTRDGETPIQIIMRADGAFSGAQGLVSDQPFGANLGAAAQTLLGGLPNFDGAISVTFSEADSTLTLDLMLVDGVGYVNFDTLTTQDIIPAEQGLIGWGGVNLPDVFASLQAQGSLDFAALDAFRPLNIDPLLFNPAVWGSFANVVRLEDTLVNNAPAAVFAASVDFAALFADDNIRGSLAAALANNTTMSDDEIAAALESAANAAIESDFLTTYTVLLDGAVVSAVNSELSIGSEFVVLATGNENAGVVNLSWTITYAPLTTPISAPAGAQIVPADELLSWLREN